MDLVVRFLGLEMLHLHASTDSPPPESEDCDDCGESTAYPLGFVARHELPDEAGLRDRQEWGE